MAHRLKYAATEILAMALLLSSFLGIATPAKAQSDLIITGVVDGPLTGGIPKAVEFFVVNNVADLSIYGFGSANNGGGSVSLRPQRAISFMWLLKLQVSPVSSDLPPTTPAAHLS